MANRTPRGGAAARYAAAMTEDIDIPEDDTPPGGEPEQITVIEDEPEPEADNLPDYSHEEAAEPDAEPETPAAAVAPPDAIAELQQQLAALRGDLDAANAKVADAETVRLQGELAQVSAGHAAAVALADRLEGAIRDASARGDHAAIAKANRELAGVVQDIRDFEADAADIKRAIQQPQRTKAAPAAPAQAGDPFEAHISTMTPASQAWCRQNRADLTKPGRDRVAVASHTVAVARGLKPDTPEYFKFLNEQMGYGDAPAVTKTTKAPPPTGRAQAAAPVSGGSRGGVTEIKLSRAEIEIARNLGMTTKAYAAQKAEIIKNGNDSNRTGPKYSQHTGHSARR